MSRGCWFLILSPTREEAWLLDFGQLAALLSTLKFAGFRGAGYYHRPPRSGLSN